MVEEVGGVWMGGCMRMLNYPIITSRTFARLCVCCLVYFVKWNDQMVAVDGKLKYSSVERIRDCNIYTVGGEQGTRLMGCVFLVVIGMLVCIGEFYLATNW